MAIKGKGKKQQGKAAAPRRNGDARPVVEDPRFAAMHALPTFRRAAKAKHKVKLDPVRTSPPPCAG